MTKATQQWALESFQFVPLAWVTARPKRDGDYRVYVDNHWALRDGQDVAVHKSESLPVANRSESVLRQVLGDLLPFDFEVVQVPVVYLQVRHTSVFSDGVFDGIDYRFVLPREAP